MTLGRIWWIACRVIAGPHWVRDEPVRPEGYGFYASTEPAGGTPPPDARFCTERAHYADNGALRFMEQHVWEWRYSPTGVAGDQSPYEVCHDCGLRREAP